jgi:aminopeptidase
MRTHVAVDDGASRLGEVALVDADSRVGRTGLTFLDTLFDENAASHIALGMAIVTAVDGATELSPEERHERGINSSSIHTDFMIGSRELEVTGVTTDGQEVPILHRGEWVLTH